VIGDLITPFKAAVGLDYRDFEKRLLGAIHLRFGLPANLAAAASSLIKRADRIAAYFEAVELAGFSTSEARKFFGRPREIETMKLEPWPPNVAKARFLERFEALSEAS
jgi:5'-deoxynucleotidase YfbR-like HD superfamily hydrolase